MRRLHIAFTVEFGKVTDPPPDREAALDSTVERSEQTTHQLGFGPPPSRPELEGTHHG